MSGSEWAVRAESLGKRYRIGERAPYHTLRETLAGVAARGLERLRPGSGGAGRRGAAGSPGADTLWALRDVSFTVPRGEVVAVIGRNGAGKSTLLKILSRITHPTEGHADIAGRVGSLLEVGTGFHPELTGRENIYLNGAILGMSRREIGARFHEIVAFSGVERFIDTPVKRYSSGMYLRLAFAVAAHLETEILLVDEVLAVGDAEFQRRCIGKMGEAAGAGRTILFVTHNLAAATQLCSRGIWLDGGRIVRDGPVQEVAEAYMARGAGGAAAWRNETPDPGAPAVIREASIAQGEASEGFRFDRPLHVSAVLRVDEPVRDLAVLLRVTDALGTVVFTSWDTDGTEGGAVRRPGTYRAVCTIPARLLRPGRYSVSVGAHVPGVTVVDMHEQALSFELSPIGYPLNVGRPGVIAPVLEWSVSRREGATAAGIDPGEATMEDER